ncbi:MAG TPA: hypothetical protein VHP33_07400 [Polyangiaceae bacterium]|nr:hypothetical protein [Polyangiaceae bacterium]
MAVTDELRAGTLRLTVAAAGFVLGLSAAAVLPLLLPWQGQGVLALVALLLSQLPCAGLLLWRRKDWSSLGLSRLATTSSAVALVSALAVVPLFNLYRGQVRVMNHGEEPFALWVDGKRVARVEPSSGESALAGAWLTLPAGERELRVVGESSGRELFRARELVQGGSPHLFAPQSAGYCFTIERRGYGSAKDEPLDSVALDGPSPFWALPDGIAWFTPNPEPGPLQTSGGTLSCLRQKRCL